MSLLDLFLEDGTLVPADQTFVTMPTSCSCGGDTAWFEYVDSAHISRGCTCHSRPSSLDLDPGSVLPTQVWFVMAQRGLTSAFTTLEEALDEMADLDDKYRPAYLMEGRVDLLQVQAVRRFSGDED